MNSDDSDADREKAQPSSIADIDGMACVPAGNRGWCRLPFSAQRTGGKTVNG